MAVVEDLLVLIDDDAPGVGLAFFTDVEGFTFSLRRGEGTGSVSVFSFSTTIGEIGTTLGMGAQVRGVVAGLGSVVVEAAEETVGATFVVVAARLLGKPDVVVDVEAACFLIMQCYYSPVLCFFIGLE